ncbi:hypothetical protein [Pelagibacterium montanilacus]|uniref:hypothetical protein n=1 Tax=Pelagibacterium montanilacus TaxID=2185280 RepID=UPI000F8CBCFB|nr:hypothetical protein [Pelagibacterium montanilacus]
MAGYGTKGRRGRWAAARLVLLMAACAITPGAGWAQDSSDFIAETIDFLPEEGTTGAGLDAGAVIPPGIYARIVGEYETETDLEAARALGCARRPAVFYPDGRYLAKEVDQTLAGMGLPPYAFRFDGQCALLDGTASCTGETIRNWGEPGVPRTVDLPFSAVAGGFALGEGDDQERYLACDLADLDQQVEGVSVLAEIIRRPEAGPFPDLGGIAIDTSDLVSMPEVDVATGPWDGTFTGALADGVGEVRIDILHMQGAPGLAHANAGFFIGAANGACADALGEALCADLGETSGWSLAVAGSMLDGERLLIAYEQGLWQMGVERELRLLDLVRSAEGGYRMTLYHPERGAELVVDGRIEPHWCEAGRSGPVDLGCDSIALQRVALAQGEGIEAEISGMFASEPERLAPLMAMIPETARTEVDSTPGSTPSDADWGGLAPGVYTNLLGRAAEPQLMALSCQEAPTISFADRTIMAKEMSGDGYAVLSVFSCDPDGDGFACDVSDGVETLAMGVPTRFSPQGEATEVCYTAGGETFCDRLQRCTAGDVTPERVKVLLARPDGGVPLTWGSARP